MLSNFFTNLGWTRDDLKWTVSVIAAIIVGLATLGNTITDYGIPLTWLPYIRLGALIVGLVSAKMATSGLPGGVKSFLIGLIALGSVIGLSACGGAPKAIPNLPALSTATDADLRASEMKVYGILQAAGVVLDQASTLEDTLAKSGAIPPATDASLRKAMASTAKGALATIDDIQAGRLKTSEALKTKVDPILADLTALQQLAQPTGHPKLLALVDALANIGVQLLMSGTGAGAMR